MVITVGSFGGVMSFLSILVIANIVCFILMLVTSGATKKFFAKVWVAVLLLGIITVAALVKSGQL